VPERGGREFAELWVEILGSRRFDRLGEVLHPDCVIDYPQSGERFVGIANIRAVFENYPGDVGPQDPASLRVAGDNERWAMAPNFTVIRTSSGAGSYTWALKARYPDGSDWFVVSMYELVDGRMTHGTLYFAPMFEAPEWRRPYAERGDTT
jgi:hypothetical protein